MQDPNSVGGGGVGPPPVATSDTERPPALDESFGGLEGSTIAGKYQLVKLLGQGGMGAVYEAKNTMTLKRCAVKVLLSPELAANQSVIKRFFREAQASSIIESDHIVQIFDSGADPETGCPYMVMEYLQGEDIEHTIERLQALHPQVAAKLVLQAAIGLGKAHEKGIVHRDIKPANLYLTGRDSGDLVVKVLDFGIAKVKMENFSETSQGLTRTGSMLGTPIYMSPEQAKGASKIDARSDVWSLGVVLYEMLSGQLPYGDVSSLGELMVQIITADIPLLQDKAPWVPPELAEITHRAMSRDVQQRYQNANGLRDALMGIIPDGSIVTPDMLVGVPTEQRQFVAPRLQLSDDGLLKATTRTGLSMTHATMADEPLPKKSNAPLVVAGAITGLVLLGGGGAAAWRISQAGASEEQIAAPPTTVVVSAEPKVIEKTVEVKERKSFDLTINPPEAEVTVDGEKLEVKDGKLAIEGDVGSTKKVVVKYKGETVEKTVAITQSGLIPSELEVKKRAGGGGRARPAAAPASKPSEPAKAAAPAPKPKPTGIETEFR